MTHLELSRRGILPRGGITLSLAAVTCISAFSVQTATGSESSNLPFRSAVVINGGEVRLADVADVTSLPKAIRARARELVVLKMPRSASTIHVDTQRVAESARRQMPILSSWLTDVRSQSIQIIREDAHPIASTRTVPESCVELQQNIGAGMAPLAEQLHPTACDSANFTRAWRYDSGAHVARAARPLVAGEIVVAPNPQRVATVRRGDSVMHSVRVGNISVARSGTVLTDTAGDRLATIRLDDGATLMRNPHQLRVQ